MREEELKSRRSRTLAAWLCRRTDTSGCMSRPRSTSAALRGSNTTSTCAAEAAVRSSRDHPRDSTRKPYGTSQAYLTHLMTSRTTETRCYRIALWPRGVASVFLRRRRRDKAGAAPPSPPTPTTCPAGRLLDGGRPLGRQPVSRAADLSPRTRPRRGTAGPPPARASGRWASPPQGKSPPAPHSPTDQQPRSPPQLRGSGRGAWWCNAHIHGVISMLD